MTRFNEAKRLSPNELANKSFGSSKSIVWKYYKALKNIIERTESTESSSSIKEDTLLTYLLSAAIIDVFVNAIFQLAIEVGGKEEFSDSFYADFNNRVFPTARMLKKWPPLLYGKTIDFEHPAMKSYTDLIHARNHLTHFKSAFASIDIDKGMSIHGVADISAFENLSKIDAIRNIKIVEEFIEYMLGVAGTSPDKIDLGLQAWTGKVPARFFQ